MKLITLFGLLSVVLSVHCYQPGCKIHLSKLPVDKAPLYLTRVGPNNSLTFAVPNGGLTIPSGGELILACPGSKNGFALQPTTNLVTVKCLESENVEIFGKSTSLREISCLLKVPSEVQNTGKTCGKPSLQVKNIGFSIPTVGFIPLINICHDVEAKVPVYAVHNLHGTAQSGQQRMTDRPQFSSVGSELPQINRFYVQAVQPKNFESLLSSKQLTDQYIHKDSFLSRGHLAPVRDFPFNSWKSATFYFANVAPQWYQTNSGNWNEIEQIVRTIGQNYRDNLKVITGTLDTLTYPDVNGRQTKMYLNAGAKSVHIPKYYWKIVVHPASRKAITFVNSNNPYEQNSQVLDGVCANVCGRAGFNLDTWKNQTAGLVTCCDVKEFKTKVPNLPFLFDSITGLLTKN